MKKSNNIVCIFNYASHYRENIYLKMEDALNCDFYFGNIEDNKIKKINYSLFKNTVFELKTINILKNFTWIKSSVSLVFKPYKKYILTGEYYSLSTWCILILNKFSDKKTYLWSHGWYGNEGFFKKLIKKLYFGLADGVFLYGNYAKDLMLSNGFENKKLHVIYNSLNYDLHLETRLKLKETDVYKDKFCNDNPTIIFIGRFTEIKKIHYLIEAQKKLTERNVKINVVFVGEGKIRESLNDLVLQNNLQDKFWFYGKSYDENEISELIFNADLCVSPGNVGLTAIHSLSYGTPVLTHDNFPNQMPEFETIQKGVTGVFFKEDSIEDLAFEIEKYLCKNELNRTVIRSKCFKVIDEKFNPNYQIEIFKNVLK